MKKNNIEKALNFMNKFSNDYLLYSQIVISGILDEDAETVNIVTNSKLLNLIEYLDNTNTKYCFENYLTFEMNNLEYKIVFTDESYKDFLSKQITTMNTIAIDSELNIVDYYNGIKDIHNKTLKIINNNSIYEDKKLMIKLIRYAAEYGFELDDSLFELINEHSPNIILVNQHVIGEEITKICMSDHPEYIKKLEEYGLLKYIIPELHLCFHTPQENPWHIYNVGDHIIEVVKNTPKDFDLRFAALFHDVGKCFCKRIGPDGIAHFYGHDKISKEKASIIFERLYFKQKDVRNALRLIELHDHRLLPKTKTVRKFIIKYKPSDEIFDKLMILQYADTMGQNPEKIKESLEILEQVKIVYSEYKKDEVTSKNINVTGRELIEIGVDKHKIKPILELLLEYISTNPDKNTKEDLIAFAKKHEKRTRPV